jgi:hypothetical protein
MVKPAAVCGGETWAMTEMDMNRLGTLKCTLTRRKIRRWFFSKSRTGGDVEVRLPSQLESFYFPHLWRFTVFPSYSSFSPLKSGLMTIVTGRSVFSL